MVRKNKTKQDWEQSCLTVQLHNRLSASHQMSYVIYCRSGWVKVVSLTLPSASMLSWAAVTPGMKRWHNTTHHLDLDSQPWRRNQWRNDAAFPLISQLVLTSCLTASNNPSVLLSKASQERSKGIFFQTGTKTTLAQVWIDNISVVKGQGLRSTTTMWKVYGYASWHKKGTFHQYSAFYLYFY